MFIAPNHLFMLLGVSEIALAVFKRANSKSEKQDRGSFFALWAVTGLAIFFAIYITFRYRQFELSFTPVQYWTGFGFFVCGTALRWWSIIHLGRFFTVNVAIAKDHRVVDDGPYRLVRHPSYTGVFLAFIGLGLLLFNWLAALVLVVPVITLFLWRMNVEEHALRQALGPAYEAYMQRTERVIPFIY